jgi:hypothetical protein
MTQSLLSYVRKHPEEQRNQTKKALVLLLILPLNHIILGKLYKQTEFLHIHKIILNLSYSYSN